MNRIGRFPGLTDRLRRLGVGERIHVPGAIASEIQDSIKRAKKGGRWYFSKTLTTGVVVERHE